MFDGGGKALQNINDLSPERGSISQTLKSFERSANETLDRISESTGSERGGDLDDKITPSNTKERGPSKADELSMRLSKIDANIRRLSKAAEPIIPIMDASSPKKVNTNNKKDGNLSML